MPRKETIQRKKHFAKLLYTREGVTNQKELAQRADVSEQTISKWKRDENWEPVRARIIITKDEELKRLYEQITELNDHIANKESGHRFANTKEADVLGKLASAVRTLETETSAADAINILMEFYNFARELDHELAGKILPVCDAYIKNLVK